MFDTTHARDLFMTAAIFALAAFIWAGWAQERPPNTASRVALGLCSVAGLGLCLPSVLNAIQHWNDGSAIDTSKPTWTIYLVIVALEVIAMVIAAVLLKRRGRSELIAPVVLLVVGLHFYPLAPVFGQNFMSVTATAITAAAVVAFWAARRRQAPSFWCGILASPLFLISSSLFLAQGLQAAG